MTVGIIAIELKFSERNTGVFGDRHAFFNYVSGMPFAEFPARLAS
jgi:hypothetical protein